MATSKKKPAAKKAAKKAPPRARKAPAGAPAQRRALTPAPAAQADPEALSLTRAGEALGSALTTARRRVLVQDDTVVAPDAPDEEPGVGEAASSYFANVDEKDGITFISSGASLIDAIFGGGYALGRVVNIVGDRSAGKTLLAIEACANFHLQFPKDKIRYAESEAAFDEAYAEALGMPVDAVDFGDSKKPLRTVEDFHVDIQAFVKKCAGKRGLYILDSLDALSDDAEAKRDITDGSFGAAKAKKMGELFRRIVDDLKQSGVLLIIISQLRDKIGVTFGEKQTRSGGRALDFYASLIVWLAEAGKIKRTIDKVERVIGVNVKARVKKNKVGLPFRECKYPILFGYGIDDMTASAEWLLEVGCENLLKKEVGMSEAGYQIRIRNLRDKGGPETREVRAKLSALVKSEWRRIEQGFLPKSRKY